ncbi:hypothetical protein [Phenylobacterium terrae]|uniref:hypothetical protein n=1 Tax=Phenylobacterium terrae TaxID=2665495 RepID=UPI00366E5F39
MIRALTLAATAALIATPALATAPEVLQPAFKNTIVSTYPDGRQAKLWLNPDGTYRAAGRRGKPSSGRWTLKGEEICLKQQRPFPAPFSYCTAVRRGGVGTSWTGKAVTGEQIRISVVAGR